MSIPESYSAMSLAQFMASQLGPFATVLGWTVGQDDAGSYEQAVIDTALALNVDDVGDVQGRAAILALRQVARRELWRLVMQQTAHKLSASGGGENVELKDLHAQAKGMFDEAAHVAAAYDTAYDPLIGRLEFVNDPYLHRSE